MIKWFALLIPDTLMTILSLILSPVLPFFATKDAHLPNWLTWFDTPDNNLDGDAGHLERHINSSTWWRRTCWLARNRAYNFSIDVLGAVVKPSDVIMERGDRKTSNRPIHSGYFYQENLETGDFQFYYVKQWSKTKCIRLNIGWKIPDRSRTTEVKCQYVFSFNPSMGISYE